MTPPRLLALLAFLAIVALLPGAAGTTAQRPPDIKLDAGTNRGGLDELGQPFEGFGCLAGRILLVHPLQQRQATFDRINERGLVSTRGAKLVKILGRPDTDSVPAHAAHDNQNVQSHRAPFTPEERITATRTASSGKNM